MRTATELVPIYAEAARATAAGSKSFFFATRFFPRELARSAHAVYWFCRTTDDLVDECTNLDEGRVQLEAWAVATRRALDEGHSPNRVLAAFTDAVARHAIPHDLPFELIEGMRMDLDCTRYRTFDELRVFCYRVASVVGLMMSHVIGFARPADQAAGLNYAIDLGIGMQLTNILRDLGEDWQRGRIYLPADEMAQFGYTREMLGRGERNPAFRALMEFQIARARRFYAASQPGVPLLNRDGRFAVQVASDVYQQILGRIERAGYDVFSQRAVVPPLEKYWITTRRMAVPMARHGLLRLKERFS
ncbi:MAG: phytoene/squalene synthase family protein [Bryobacteraceae bacterium]|nr:phytoene/squalene synthase family protein [Bryobacteraceae bacterium]